ncbi:phage holin family protein [Marinilabilia salmonicolor]|uniref:phage holin family protein n=1 Tax=Marinilabilia salmonicolor TaxID=989 RepID=UPI000299F618|nr:phage holin family protein [Marinilabilia salmonicolor]
MKESITSEIDELKKELEEYLQIRVDLVKLHIAGELSRFFSSFMTKTVLLYLFFFVFMFFSLAAALLLGTWLDSYALGFAIMGGVFLLAALIFWLLRKQLIERHVVHRFIELMFPKFEDDDSKY